MSNKIRLIFLFLLMTLTSSMMAQTAMSDSYPMEYREGKPYMVVEKGNIVVAHNLSTFGSYYRLVFDVQNHSGHSFDLRPDSIFVTLTDFKHKEKPLEVYSKEKLQKKVENSQFWFDILSDGIDATFAKAPSSDAEESTRDLVRAESNAKEVNRYVADYLQRHTLHPGMQKTCVISARYKRGFSVRVEAYFDGQCFAYEWNLRKMKFQ